MARIHRILHNGLYILPETVTDAVLDNQMQRTLTELLNDKLSAVDDDTAHGEITFEAGLVAKGDGVNATKVVAPVGEIKQFTADKITTEHIESADYLGDTSGFKLANVNGGSYLEVDKLSVRKKAIFTELDIKRLDHIGGATVTSPASCRIEKVEPYAGGYKCYFRAEDGERAINNDWKIGDQAMCHAYNTTTPRYYWRLVIAVSTEIEGGYHWVALSSNDCDADSDEPMAEDVIACFGNRTDTDRQQVIITNSEGVNSPYIQQLKGINSYNITDANVVTQLSPSKNIIRGEQIELTTSSGNKGVQDLANDALKSAKTYTDTAFGNAKDYTDTSVGSAKEYADGVANTAETNAKGYADGVGSTVKGYADGLFADAENYTQEREAYLQTQITANDEEIALRATKVEVQTVSDNVGALATRVTGAEASIKTNADNIALKAAKTEVDTIKTDLGEVTSRVSTAEAAIQVNADNINLRATKTEVQGQFDNLQVGQRNYAPNTSVAMTAYQFRDCYYPDNFRGKTAKITYRATYNITALPSGSYAGIQVHITYNDGTQSWIGAGVNDGISVGTATNKLIKKTIAVDNKKVQRFRVYCQFKEGATGTFSIDQLMVNPDTFADWSPAPEDTADSIDKLGTRVTAAESQIAVNAEGIASTVERINAIVEDVSMDGFTNDTIQYYSVYDGLMMSYNDGTDRNFRCSINLGARNKGDVIRITNPDGIIAYILACDGDTAAAQALITKHNVNITDETLLGVCLQASGNEYVSPITYTPSIEMVLEQDAPIVFIQIKDDYRGKWKNSTVTIISERYSAQSRIDQSADNIRLQVGQAGINLDTKVITLDASKTIVTGDLAVRTVKCYYDAAQTQIKSAYNGNGDGTIVYYYPNGMVMRKDSFVTDSSGNAIGMRTTYYNADGSVSWVLDNSGLKTTLSDYWEALNGAQPMAYTTDYNTMMNTCKQWLDQAMQYFDESTFSRFVSQSGNYKNYNGKVAKGLKSSEAPTAVTFFAGVLVYSVELYKDGLLPTYIVTYELVTTAQNQVGAIMTQKFNVSGEVN